MNAPSSAVATGATLPAKRPFLSPTSKRRLANFKANKRGFWSFWIFLVLFTLSMFAEFIANDRPIFASYKDDLATDPLFLSDGQLADPPFGSDRTFLADVEG